jgi:hypothetical protein
MKARGLTPEARRRQGRRREGSGGRLLSAATGPVGEDEEGCKVRTAPCGLRRGHGGGPKGPRLPPAPEGSDGKDDGREGAWEHAMEGPHELGGSWVE